jgi:hypothetical protein
VEEALVDQSQNCVENRRVGLEYLIQEGNVRFGQFMAGHPAIIVLFQRF